MLRPRWERLADACPDCEATGRVVTAVTVSTLGDAPRMVLVTRQCTRCYHKYPVMKAEPQLTDEERGLWRSP